MLKGGICRRFGVLLIIATVTLFIGARSESNLSLQQSLSHESQKGRIIFVTGSCSSGKSSMSQIIAQRLNAQYFAFDEYVMPLILKKFVTKHYGKVLAIS